MNDTTKNQIDRIGKLLPEYKYYKYNGRDLNTCCAGLFQKPILIDNKRAFFVSIEIYNFHLEFRHAEDFVSFYVSAIMYPKGASYEHNIKFNFNMTDSDDEIIKELKELEEHCLKFFTTSQFRFYDDKD